jgi:hypothetical protein
MAVPMLSHAEADGLAREAQGPSDGDDFWRPLATGRPADLIEGVQIMTLRSARPGFGDSSWLFAGLQRRSLGTSNGRGAWQLSWAPRKWDGSHG